MGDQNKMKAPSAPVLLGLLIIVLLSSTPACQASSLWPPKPLRNPFLWGAVDLPLWIKGHILAVQRKEQMSRPQEMSQERFQRGVDPADEGQEVDMRMIFDALKRDIRAAIEEEDVASNTEKKEEEPEKKEEEPSTSPHLKEFSPYFSLYKYRL